MRRLSLLGSAALCVAMTLGGGCGLVFQGFHQDVNLVVDGGPAEVTFVGETKTAPATFKVRRRPNWRVVRAEAPGMAPGCALVQCAQNRPLRILGMIPLFIPFAFDAALGTLGDCPDTVYVQLRGAPKGAPAITIPPDDWIAQVGRISLGLIDPCRAPHLYDERFGHAAQRITVTAGPLPGEYDVVGPVDVTFAGYDFTRANTVGFRSGNFAYSNTQVSRQFFQASPAMVNEVVRREALFRYGDRVDAVVNVDYLINPRNDVSATGLAVKFRE